MTQVKTFNWTDAFGNVYPFQLDPIGSRYNARPGVYIFSKLVGNTWTAIYIGECESFRDRLDSPYVHHRWECIKNQGATHIFTMHVPGDLIARESIETNLRRSFQTPCNQQ